MQIACQLFIFSDNFDKNLIDNNDKATETTSGLVHFVKTLFMQFSPNRCNLLSVSCLKESH